MSHDKIRAAARKRVAETGEPYAAALRAVVNGHQGGARIPFPDTGYVLRMSGEIHDWLAGLRDSNPRAARRVAQTLAALMEEGASLGDRWWSPHAGGGCELLQGLAVLLAQGPQAGSYTSDDGVSGFGQHVRILPLPQKIRPRGSSAVTMPYE
jgi:hypothetical protein